MRHRVRKIYGVDIDNRREMAKQKIFEDLVVKKDLEIEQNNKDQETIQLKER